MNDGKKQLQWNGEQLVQKILDKRYNSDYELYNKYPLVQQAWKIAPIPLQQWFLKLIKEKRMYFSSSEISPEVECIDFLIEQFERYYADDLPIYYGL
jgi:hypothetical protein